MIEPAGIAQSAVVTTEVEAQHPDEEDVSMRVLEWLMAGVALLAALGLAILR